MATGDAYSSLIQISKIVLPLFALAILSTLFLFSRAIDPQDAIPFADIDVEQIAQEQRLTKPRFATVGEDGAAIEMSATEARPNPDYANRVEALNILGTIDLPEGDRITLLAGSAIIDLDDQTAGLTNEVRVETTNGYEIAAVELLSRLDRAELNSDGPVLVRTPFGGLEAGGMQLSQKDDEYRLVFNNKVKLLYRPEGGRRN